MTTSNSKLKSFWLVTLLKRDADQQDDRIFRMPYALS